ncbi:hypothetical protein Nmel_001558 [Mimus melanotis]
MKRRTVPGFCHKSADTLWVVGAANSKTSNSLRVGMPWSGLSAN